jgi:signal transduction histidine kinase
VSLADKLRLGTGMNVACAAVLAYGTLSATVRNEPSVPITVALVAVGLAILILTIRIDVVDRIGVPVYLAIQTVLVTVCMLLSDGIVTLHYMPVIAQAALVCRRSVLLAICAGFGAEHFAFGAYFLSLRTSTIELVGFAAAAAFVVVLTQVVAAERRSRSAVAQLATMQERNRLAREIHDSLGHYLTVIHVQLQIASRSIGTDVEAAAAAVKQASRLTHEGLEDVRRSVAALRAPVEQDQPLPDAIAAIVTQLAAKAAATFAVRGDPRELPPAVSLTLFRTAQEALTNVEKHAGAAHVTIDLVFKPSTVELVVADDGRGSDLRDGNSGFGLLGVRERVAQVGGTVDIASKPGEGFRLSVELPA